MSFHLLSSSPFLRYRAWLSGEPGGSRRCVSAYASEYKPEMTCQKGISARHVSQCTTYLGGLDVIVEVVTEGLDVGDNIGHPLRSKMAREQDCLLLLAKPSDSFIVEHGIPKVT